MRYIHSNPRSSRILSHHDPPSLAKSEGIMMDAAGRPVPPTIIYASRTHSQLSQVVRELKRTAYAKTRVCVLGSRDQLCIEPEVQKLDSNAAKTQMCRTLVSTDTMYSHQWE